MTDYYKPVRFNGEAMEYIRYCLDGFLSLRRLVQQKVSIEAGSVWTRLPVFVSPDRARLFQSGFLPEQIDAQQIVRHQPDVVERWVPTSNMIPMLVEYIGTYLQEDPAHLCVFEDILASPTDRWIQNPGGTDLLVATYSEEVYLLLLAEDGYTPTRIESTIWECPNAYQFFCLLTNADTATQRALQASRLLSKDMLANFVENAEGMVFGAYDGEGYLFWTNALKQSSIS